MEMRCGHCLSSEMAVQDGVLSDGELNDFQVHCFAVPLQPEELSGVKTVVLKGMREVSSAIDVLATLHSHAAPAEQPEEVSGVRHRSSKGCER